MELSILNTRLLPPQQGANTYRDHVGDVDGVAVTVGVTEFVGVTELVGVTVGVVVGDALLGGLVGVGVTVGVTVGVGVFDGHSPYLVEQPVPAHPPVNISLIDIVGESVVV